jgi:hypothetical protein
MESIPFGDDPSTQKCACGGPSLKIHRTFFLSSGRRFCLQKKKYIEQIRVKK